MTDTPFGQQTDVDGPDASGAELLVASLEHAGVSTIFGVPGDTGVSFYDALLRRSSSIRHILANDERGAVFMADVYARASKQVGVVEVSSGGGVTFAVGGLGEAFAASIPLVVLTSDISRASRGTGALTEIDQVALFKAVTKWQGIAESAAEIPALLDIALKTAASGRPAPVVLIIPEDILDEISNATMLPHPVNVPAERPAAEDRAVESAATAVASAHRPAMLVGSGAHLSGAYSEIQDFADRLAVPVATSIHGKGAISERNEWSLGVAGANGGREYANQYLASADCVLLVGTRANSTDTCGFTSPPRSSPSIVRIDIDPSRISGSYPHAIPLIGDVATVLKQILNQTQVPQAPNERREVIEWIREQRVSWESPIPASPASASACDPRSVFEAIREVAGDDCPVVADCGTATPYLAAYWTITTPGRSLVLARGHGPMGYAFPGAVGLAFAHPNESVIAIVTDGSLLMAVGALEPVARLNLPITFVHLANGTLGWIKALQHFYFGARYLSTDISRFDAVGIARGFGLESCHVSDIAELSRQVRRGLESHRPLFLDVSIPSEYERVPPVAGWAASFRRDTGTRPVY